ncbi:uncharacterized protein LOC119573458 [Penaeus monodon]|uniref:uncharacterized protein LOC119573458 n=1 Tax=Penaeus monodon TaxID=6687 RepID=UPI0018A746FF|nr:uncharacterized protein LOC119573458 [Penaeus monodon]
MIPPCNTIEELYIPSTIEELKKVIAQTSSGKAPGPIMLQTFLHLLLDIWEEEAIPSDLRDATVISLYKNEGSRTDCGIHRGISLLSIAGKILALIILNRLVTSISEKNLPESQCGYQPDRSTINMQEKCTEQNKNLYAVFIDLTKAFGTVSRDVVWIIVPKYRSPRNFHGIYIKYRLDGSFFDLRRFNAKSKIRERFIIEALFADDLALMAHCENDLQLIVNQFTVFSPFWIDYQRCKD